MKTLVVIHDELLEPKECSLLHQHGWSVHQAIHEQAALEYITAHPPDLIALNLSSEHLESAGLAMALTCHPITADIPLLLFNVPDATLMASPKLGAATPTPATFASTLTDVLVGVARARPLVLIVDDEPDVIDIITRGLHQDGYDAVGAFNGFQGLRIARLIRPDAILLDLDMPRFNGWQVLDHLKRDEQCAAMRVVILTGAVCTAQGRQRGLASGADAYLFKPCGLAEIARTLQTVLPAHPPRGTR